jgi:hypothetical protein
MAFRNLFIKELKSILPMYAVFSFLVVLLHVFILYKSKVWEDETILVSSIMLPFIFLAATVIGTGYYQLHTEWKANSIYLLLSLPVRGWKVLSAKLGAVLSYFIVTCLWIGISFTIFLVRVLLDKLKGNVDLMDILPTLLNVVVNTLWMYVLVVVFVLVVIQFAFLCGQLVAKFKWFVVLSAFLGVMWLVFRITPLLSSLLLWTPDIFWGGMESDVVYFHSGPFIIMFLLIVGFVWLNGYIFEKEVEV